MLDGPQKLLEIHSFTLLLALTAIVPKNPRKFTSFTTLNNAANTKASSPPATASGSLQASMPEAFSPPKQSQTPKYFELNNENTDKQQFPPTTTIGVFESFNTKQPKKTASKGAPGFWCCGSQQWHCLTSWGLTLLWTYCMPLRVAHLIIDTSGITVICHLLVLAITWRSFRADTGKERLA